MKKKNKRQKISSNPVRNLTGYALTEYLETNLEFLELLNLVKGEDQLPACIHMMRSVAKRRASASKHN